MPDIDDMTRGELVREHSPELTGKDRRDLRGRGHDLHPVVLVGDAGVSDGVVDQFEQQIEAHELIKVKVHAKSMIAETAHSLHEATGAQLAQSIGNVLLFYKPHPEDPAIELPSDSS